MTTKKTTKKTAAKKAPAKKAATKKTATKKVSSKKAAAGEDQPSMLAMAEEPDKSGTTKDYQTG